MKKKALSRGALHSPLGALTVYAGGIHWVYAIVLLVSFLAYEVTEDWRIRDHAYLDIAGYIAGFVGVLLGANIIGVPFSF